MVYQRAKDDFNPTNLIAKLSRDKELHAHGENEEAFAEILRLISAS